MKRSISMILAVFITVVSVLIVNNFSFSKEQENIEDVIVKTIDNNKVEIDSAANSLNKDDFIFSSVYSMKRNVSYEEYEEMFAYVRFAIKNSITSEELQYINSLLQQGYRLRIIEEVYDFWLTTNEDIEFIGKCLELSDKYWGEHWIENAFNYLTDNKCGVLESKQEIEAYLNVGLTTEDIRIANILCRKNVYTIQEILKMKLDGKEWKDICYEISPSDVYKYSNDAEDISVLHIESDSQINALMEKFYVQDKTELFERINEAEKMLEQYLEEKCDEKLSEMNIFCNSSLPANEYEKRNELRQNILSNGMAENDINLLARRGYEYEEIYEISALISQNKNISVPDAVKKIFGGDR